MHPRKNVVIITNPAAGKGKSGQIADQIAESLRRLDNNAEIVRTSGPGGAGEAASSIGSDVDLIVSVGGDGTLHEIVNGLVRDVPIGVYPAGTANAVASGLGIPPDIGKATEIFDSLDLRRIDLGEVGGSKFTLCASAGCDAEVIRRLTSVRKGSIAVLSYLPPVLGALKDYGFPEFTVRVDGAVVSDHATLAVVGNLREYGINMPVALKARPNDGLLDVCLLESRTVFGHLRFFGYVLMGRHLTLPGVRYAQGKRISFEPKVEAAPFQVDGEEAGAIPVDIKVVPGALRVCVGPNSVIDLRDAE